MKLIFDKLKFEFNFLLEKPLYVRLISLGVKIVTCILQYNVKSTLYVMNVVKKFKILTESNK